MSKLLRRIAITGVGLISPIGNDPATVWQALSGRRSGVRALQGLPTEQLATRVGAQALDFTGDIADFGPLEKMTQRAIKKGLKLMCREIQMGVASAQLALNDARLDLNSVDRDRVGTMFGSDYIMTLPDEFTEGIKACLNPAGTFDFTRWGEFGRPQVEPLWLLKYLPNMPASHVAIYNDLRGPSNSVTVREASSNLSIAEAATTIGRGAADVMVAGATGTRVHGVRTIHVCLQEQVAPGSDRPEQDARPFDRDRTGLVIGEGAGTIVVEDWDHAARRGAPLYGEIVGYGSSCAVNRDGQANYERAFHTVIGQALAIAEMKPSDIGHVHAHGLGTFTCDVAEARAIASWFGRTTPVTTAKSYLGNLGAGGGLVELIASLLALRERQLFPILNLEHVDPACEINAIQEFCDPGRSMLNLSITPQGQASALIVQAI